MMDLNQDLVWVAPECLVVACLRCHLWEEQALAAQEQALVLAACQVCPVGVALELEPVLVLGPVECHLAWKAWLK